MKQFFTLLAIMAISVSVFAQAPESLSYQAVIRNSSNELVTSQGVGMQISILQGSQDGPVVYWETHSVTTNENGLVTSEVGKGNTYYMKNGPFMAGAVRRF
ncbi:MAG TPA: hypothetical protein ENN63_06340 [Bacteroidetes bacterium]|nr:hypothetical protein [Bacteroidota bacterium]